MIAKWKVFNFKSIREETELDLGPLTIFAGANSSGKSTFIQSILLVAQTLAHKVGSHSVVLNGALTSLGQFDDLKSTGGESDQITIKCTCRPVRSQHAVIRRRSQFVHGPSAYYGLRTNGLQEIACEVSFDADSSSSERDLLQIRPRLFATQLSCVSRDQDNVGQKAGISIHHSTKAVFEIEGADGASEIDDRVRASLSYAVELDEISMNEVKEDFRSASPVGCILRHFLPERIVCSIDTVEENANAITMALQDDIRRAMGWRRSVGGENLLSGEIIAILREVLEGTIDFDHAFKDKDRGDSSFGSDPGTLTFTEWYDGLRDLPRTERLMVQQVLRESEDLFDRIHAAMKASASEKSDDPFLCPAQATSLDYGSRVVPGQFLRILFEIPRSIERCPQAAVPARTSRRSP